MIVDAHKHLFTSCSVLHSSPHLWRWCDGFSFHRLNDFAAIHFSCLPWSSSSALDCLLIETIWGCCWLLVSSSVFYWISCWMCRIMLNVTLATALVFSLILLLWGKYKLKSINAPVGETHYRATSVHKYSTRFRSAIYWWVSTGALVLMPCVSVCDTKFLKSLQEPDLVDVWTQIFWPLQKSKT